MNDALLDAQIDRLHLALEAKERDARAAELRLQRLNLPPGSLKPRNYGEMPNVSGLTARALLARNDPALAALLGLPVPRPDYEAHDRQVARDQQIARMSEATAQARQQNQAAAAQRYRARITGIDPLTNRRPI